MVEAWRSGMDIVLMRRRSRNGEGALKRFCAYMFYRLLCRLSDVTIPKDVGDFRLMSRRAIDALGRLRERNRYMKGLFAWIGLPTKVISFDREPRAAGDSKWNFIGLMRLAMEGLTSFSVSPLRCVTFLGLLTALGSAMYGALIDPFSRFDSNTGANGDLLGVHIAPCVVGLSHGGLFRGQVE